MTKCVTMQRAVGALRIGAHSGGLGELAQSGCLRACFPKRHGGALEAVIVNTAGGIADGDDLRMDVQAANTMLVVTTPSAERIYRARAEAPAACVTITLRVGAGAKLAFLPQETILFNNCALDRTLDVDMHDQATYLGVEPLVFGRQESRETITNIRLRDTLRLRRGGRLILQDGVRLQGDVRALLASATGASGARALATIVFAAPGASTRLDRVRDILADLQVQGGASTWDGLLVTRILAPDAISLRPAVTALLSSLLDSPLPRVWSS